MLERIVSLEPNVTATLIALGQRERLVAVTRYCSRLVNVDGIPQLEPTWSVKADQVAALKPDLVVAGIPYRAGKVDELLKAKLNVLCLYPKSLNDVYEHTMSLGRLCDASSKAETIVSDMKASLAILQQQAATEAGKRGLRVYVESWNKPLMNAAPWVAELVELFGGQAVLEPHGPRQVTKEEVLAADPEVIILNWAGVEEMDPSKVLENRMEDGWGNVTALKNNHVVAVNEIYLNAPGPNLVEGARELYQAMYK